MSNERALAYSLLSADAVRTRANTMLALGLDDKLPHFRVDLGRLDDTTDLVIATTRQTYPTLAVPMHSRWRHFVVRDEDRYATLTAGTRWPDVAAQARAAFDLAIVSVLLDAGAGATWCFHDAKSGKTIGRSEGLALASLDMFGRGAFSATPADPLRADAERLRTLTADELAAAFQVSDRNPLPNITHRAALLNALGDCVAATPAVFARHDTPRPGGLFDHLVALADRGRIVAPTIVAELLRHLGPIWPTRLTLGGVPLGDCWRHPALRQADATDGLVPLHKLSQWLAYSLIEPLQQAGITVTDIDGLTGLAEYRNGGLFVDTGALILRDPNQATLDHEVGDPLVVEWRALTVALLDRLAQRMRSKLGLSAAALPLASVLEGGTWAAGRAIARQLRPSGAPPIRVISDGTVF
jgi:Protein of unknown function (DUF1688)